MLRHLREFNFQGRVHVVNPNRSLVQGHKAYASILDVADDTELAVIMVSAPLVLQVLRECVQHGVRVVIIGSSGFAEASDEGRRMQQELLELSQQSGMRIIGPNCNGVTSIRSMLVGSTISLDEQGLAMTDDGVALVSQSGAIGGLILAASQRSGLGVGLTVAIGNAVDIGLEEVLTEFARDPDIKVVLAYVEGIKRGRDFIAAIQLLHQAQKPIIVLKAGATETGTRAAISHTGAMAGEPFVIRDVFESLGLIQAHSLTELSDIAQIEKSAHGRIGPSASVLSMGGGTAVLTSDLLEMNGMRLADWPEDDITNLLTLLPRAAHQNPFDTGLVVSDPKHLLNIVAIADRQVDSDVTILICAFLVKQEVEIADALANAASDGTFEKPLVIVWLGGSGYAAKRLNTTGVPCFPDPARAINALGAIVHSSRSTLSISSVQAVSHYGADPIADALWDSTTSTSSDLNPKELLATYSISVAESQYATTIEECISAADALGYPVVVKLLSRELSHKTDVGAVRLNVRDSAEVRREAQALLSLSEHLELDDSTLSVQNHFQGSLELILSMTTDPTFGPIVNFGIGGVATELTNDVIHFLPSVTADDVPRIVDRLKYRQLFFGFRGSPVVDLEALTTTLLNFVSLGNAMCSHFSEIEINPLLVTGDGANFVALDYLFVER
jgi:acyl-CoA synthetase (NDP forming)